jgi:LmbE family N-acetylglucosaminyl deacetylase
MERTVRTAAVIVAHPDDETLWAGGAILQRRQWSWTIVSLCRQSDPDRAPKFFSALERLGAGGVMADLDDGPDQRPLDIGEVETVVLSLLPKDQYDVVVTHSPFGEYTRHRRHEEIGRAVTRLWTARRLTAGELWLFAYEDGDKRYLPRPIGSAHAKMRLPESVWLEKAGIIKEIYGFAPDSWEATTTPRVEAFWRFDDAAAFAEWLEGERAKRGHSK